MKQLRLEILADYGIPEDVQDQFFHLAIEPDFPAAAPGQDQCRLNCSLILHDCIPFRLRLT